MHLVHLLLNSLYEWIQDGKKKGQKKPERQKQENSERGLKDKKKR